MRLKRCDNSWGSPSCMILYRPIRRRIKLNHAKKSTYQGWLYCIHISLLKISKTQSTCSFILNLRGYSVLLNTTKSPCKNPLIGLTFCNRERIRDCRWVTIIMKNSPWWNWESKKNKKGKKDWSGKNKRQKQKNSLLRREPPPPNSWNKELKESL